MQIEFTKEQYESLLKLIYCWDMMINWPRLFQDRILDFDNLCSYIYSKAKDFWLENHVEYWEDKNIYIASNELEYNEEINSYIEIYDEDNDNFWENLIDMLAERDFEEKNTNPLFEKNDKIFEKIIDSYDEEFTKNWIKNLRLDKAHWES